MNIEAIISDKSNTSSQLDSAVPRDEPERKVTLEKPNEDRSLRHVGVAGDTYTLLGTGQDTTGRYCLLDMHLPPGGGPALHQHGFEEMFSVLEGKIEVTFRGDKQVLRAGKTVNIPANAPHHFKNAASKPAWLLCICPPTGHDEFSMAVGDPVAGVGRFSMRGLDRCRGDWLLDAPCTTCANYTGPLSAARERPENEPR